MIRLTPDATLIVRQFLLVKLLRTA